MSLENICHNAEITEYIIYCQKTGGCKYIGEYAIPYAKNGRCGGRKYECKKYSLLEIKQLKHEV